MNKRYGIYLLTLGLLTVSGCANRGMGPQGGPKDETPPKVVKETPQNGVLNYTGKDIQIVFDEYIQLDNIAENLLISPPQQQPPEVSAIGKKLSIHFDKDLQDSTTYTLQFGKAICDNNEKNVLEDYTFSFSTGSVIDSMQIGGIMLNARDLNPISGILAGVHTDTTDTAFERTPFLRIGRTNSVGEFTISNLKHGTYRLYGLQDLSKDYMWQTGEGMALCDSLIIPTVEMQSRADTIWADSITIDTIISQPRPSYGPQDIVLLYFQENKQRHYFQRALREQQNHFTLLFGAPQDTLPKITPIGEDWSEHTICQYNNTKDTITYWLTDSTVIKTDTLEFALTYMKSDSLFQLQEQKDTVRAIYRAPRVNNRSKNRANAKPETRELTLSCNAKSPFEIYEPLRLRTATPIARYEKDSIHLYEVIDSIRKPLQYKIEAADSAYANYAIIYPWKAAKTYELVIDSAAFTDIYRSSNKAQQNTFTIRTLDEYSTLIVKIEPFDSAAIIEVLNGKDEVMRTLPAQQDGAVFEHLKPDSYYLRLFLDMDGDGQWTTGDWFLKKQPEPVYYFGGQLTLRANWDIEETFEYLRTPITEQKPKDLIKDASSKTGKR
ncbi:MAG TPA: hypothetical protein DIW30_06250 [Bacteroidales bacterium]|nr:hypothetical protein [Bacteroidales bacterium]